MPFDIWWNHQYHAFDLYPKTISSIISSKSNKFRSAILFLKAKIKPKNPLLFPSMLQVYLSCTSPIISFFLTSFFFVVVVMFLCLKLWKRNIFCMNFPDKYLLTFYFSYYCMVINFTVMFSLWFWICNTSLIPF